MVVAASPVASHVLGRSEGSACCNRSLASGFRGLLVTTPSVCASCRQASTVAGTALGVKAGGVLALEVCCQPCCGCCLVGLLTRVAALAFAPSCQAGGHLTRPPQVDGWVGSGHCMPLPCPAPQTQARSPTCTTQKCERGGWLNACVHVLFPATLLSDLCWDLHTCSQVVQRWLGWVFVCCGCELTTPCVYVCVRCVCLVLRRCVPHVLYSAFACLPGYEAFGSWWC